MQQWTGLLLHCAQNAKNNVHIVAELVSDKEKHHKMKLIAICSDAFPNWDSMFTEMLERPPDVVVVEIKTNNAGRGLSKNNPYREKEVSLL